MIPFPVLPVIVPPSGLGIEAFPAIDDAEASDPTNPEPPPPPVLFDPTVPP